VVNARDFVDGYDGRTNQDFFLNLNAQAWWELRTRFYETFKASIGESYDPELLISLDPDLPELRVLKNELAQALFSYNANGKVAITKTPPGHKSPNLADSLKQAFAPTFLGIQVLGIF
jgi:phage terminase large subunit